MKVLLDEKGYVTSFAIEGELVDGMETPAPEDIDHFAEHFQAYRVQEEKLLFDEAKLTVLTEQAETETLRQRRQEECFSVINRGQLWYEGVSVTQLLELRQWYKAWLNVTETKVIPERPAWLE